MRLVRYLQHWLGGTGPRLQVTDFVPDAHPIRQWADTFPWPVLVAAIETTFCHTLPETFQQRPSPRAGPGLVGPGITQTRTGWVR